jgi:predicted transcriptional regulator
MSSLEQINIYCSKIKKIRRDWDSTTLKYYLIGQMEIMAGPELWNIYVFNDKKQNFEIDGSRIDYQV